MRDTDPKKSAILVIHRVPCVASQSALVRSKRWLLRCAVLLLTVIFFGGFFWTPLSDYESFEKQAVGVYREKPNPRLMAEMDALKGQVVGLVSGSIESKLRTLETSLKTGTLDGSLSTLEEIKNDLKILRAYGPVEAEKIPAVRVDSERLAQEMSHLKRLIYLILASCGLMLAAVTGVWLKRQQLPFKEVVVRFLLKL